MVTTASQELWSNSDKTFESKRLEVMTYYYNAAGLAQMSHKTHASVISRRLNSGVGHAYWSIRLEFFLAAAYRQNALGSSTLWSIGHVEKPV